MKPLALVGALVGGGLGALAWAGIAYATELEIGYVAWGVGLLVGFGCVFCGGRGRTHAVSAAVIALVAILCGKALTVRMVFENTLARAVYEFLAPQAQAFAQVRSESQYPRFMVDHGFTDAQQAHEVPQDEVNKFASEVAPILRQMGNGEPSYENWRSSPAAEASLASVGTNVSYFGMAVEGLNPIDFLFFLLGVGTAFKVVASAQEKAAPKPQPQVEGLRS